MIPLAQEAISALTLGTHTLQVALGPAASPDSVVAKFKTGKISVTELLAGLTDTDGCKIVEISDQQYRVVPSNTDLPITAYVSPNIGNTVWDRTDVWDVLFDQETRIRLLSAKTTLDSASCTSCARKNRTNQLLRQVAALDPATATDKQKAAVLELLGRCFQREWLQRGPLKSHSEALLPPVPKTASGNNAPRPACLDCARKHIAQAIVLLGESRMGYPNHRWLAVGHLAEASEELLNEYAALAGDLREERLKVMADAQYMPNLMVYFDKFDSAQA